MVATSLSEAERNVDRREPDPLDAPLRDLRASLLEVLREGATLASLTLAQTRLRLRDLVLRAVGVFTAWITGTVLVIVGAVLAVRGLCGAIASLAGAEWFGELLGGLFVVLAIAFAAHAARRKAVSQSADQVAARFGAAPRAHQPGSVPAPLRREPDDVVAQN